MLDDDDRDLVKGDLAFLDEFGLDRACLIVLLFPPERPLTALPKAIPLLVGIARLLGVRVVPVALAHLRPQDLAILVVRDVEHVVRVDVVGIGFKAALQAIGLRGRHYSASGRDVDHDVETPLDLGPLRDFANEDLDAVRAFSLRRTVPKALDRVRRSVDLASRGNLEEVVVRDVDHLAREVVATRALPALREVRLILEAELEEVCPEVLGAALVALPTEGPVRSLRRVRRMDRVQPGILICHIKPPLGQTVCARSRR
ncbi:hypothetical protein D3C87_1265970 [compost metagenome]